MVDKQYFHCPKCGLRAPKDVLVITDHINKRGRKEPVPWEPGCLIPTILAIGGIVAFLLPYWSLYARIVVLILSVPVLLFTLVLLVRLPKLTRVRHYHCKKCGTELEGWKPGSRYTQTPAGSEPT